MKREYKTESETLAKAIDIAISCYEEIWPEGFNESQIKHVISVYSEWKEQTLNPKPNFRNLQSLKYQEQEVFTYFQEGQGKTVELFWKRLKEENFPYKRKNPLTAILKRKRIKNEFEYNFVTDTVVALQKEGAITEEQATELKSMLGDFEEKAKK